MTRSRDLSEIVNSTGLSVDTDTLVVDSANNRVGVGTASPATALDVTGTVTADGLTIDGTIEIANQDAINELSFTGTEFTNVLSATTSGFQLGTTGAGYLAFLTSNSEAARIDAQGQVRLSNTTPVWDTTFNTLVAKGGFFGSQSASYLYSGQNIYYNGDFKFSTAADATLYEQSFGKHIWYRSTDASPAADAAITLEAAMTLDDSGNLLVGKTSTSQTVEGIVLQGADGRINASADGNVAGIFNRLTNDGDIFLFRKDGADVGSIGTVSGYLYVGGTAGDDAFLSFGANGVRPSTSAGAARDAAIDLGGSTNRFKDLYLEGNITLSRDTHSTTKDVVNISTAQFDAGATFQTGEFILFGDWDGSSDKMLALKRAGSDVLAVDASGNLHSPGFSKISGTKSCPENATTSLGYLTFNANEHVVVRITITSSNLVNTNDYASAVGTRTIGASHSGTVGGSINVGTLEAANVVIVHGGNSAILTGIDITEDSPSPGQLSINAVIGNNGTATSATVGYTIELLGGNANTLGWTTV